MRRLLAVLVLTSMLLSALAMIVPSVVALPTGEPISAEASFIGPNGVTLRMMTDADLQIMKENVGTRVDGVNYDVIVDGYHTGLAPPSSESWERMAGKAFLAEVPATLELGAPAAYDMSTNSWFPAVGNQGSQGSCAAWAATYYCYGAVEAKDNGWTLSKSGVAAQLLSPAWTYNRVANRGPGGGSWMGENFYVIEDWGVPTLSTFPYSASNAVFWGSPAAWREAPLHRGADVVYVGGGTIGDLKALVANDQPVTFAIDADQFASALDEDFVILADEYNVGGSLNHAQTVVGYNDSISVAGHDDIGAFRIVNSWGAGWEDGGYYWISYDAFEEIMAEDGNELCYITDIRDYVPSLLAVWHYNNPPDRNADHILSIDSGSPGSKEPYYASDSLNALPSFMVCDISEFRSAYDSGATRFTLEVARGDPSVISSFRIESYEGGYSPGAPTQVSGQSSQVPKATPGSLDVIFPEYPSIIPALAMDQVGLTFSNPELADWVGVEAPSLYGGSAMQAGDVGDSQKSTIQVTVSGYRGISFFWKVSSEQSKDYLRFYEASMKAEISGDSGWRQVWYYFSDLGAHTVKWSYEKSGTTSSLQDGAWVDNLQLLESGVGNDTTPPITSINVQGDIGANGWYRASVSAVLAAVDSESGIRETRYRLDSSLWVEYNSIIRISSDGQHLLEYYSTDSSGNIEDIKSRTIWVDAEDPIAWSSLLGMVGLDGWYVSGVQAAILALDDMSGVSSILYSLDGSEYEEYVNAIDVAAGGAHSLSYYPVDNAGNEGDMQSVVFSIDTDLPVASVILNGTAGNGDWYVSAVGVGVGAVDGTSGIERIEYRLDGGPWSNYSSGLQVENEGAHTFECRAVDKAGNIGLPQMLNLSIDTVAPLESISITGIQGVGGWYTSLVELTISAVDETSGVSQTFMRVNGGDWVSGATGSFSNGVFEIEFYSVDSAGNPSPIRSDTVMSDVEMPLTVPQAVGTMSESGWFTSNISLELVANDNLSGVDSTFYRIDGGDWVAYNGSIVFDDAGSSLIEFHSIDRAGNSEQLRSYEVKVDKSAPISSAQVQGTVGAGGWYVSSLLIDIGAIDVGSDVASIRYKLDSDEWLVYSGQISVESCGAHVLQFYSVDHAGNTEMVRTADIGIDIDVPTVSAHIDGKVFSTNLVSLNWTSNDSTSAVGTIELSVDGAPYQMFGGTQSNITIPSLSDGLHSLSIRATDQAGNKAVSEFSFEVDTNPISPQGPYGSTLLIALLCAVALVAGLLILRARRR